MICVDYYLKVNQLGYGFEGIVICYFIQFCEFLLRVIFIK